MISAYSRRVTITYINGLRNAVRSKYNPLSKDDLNRDHPSRGLSLRCIIKTWIRERSGIIRFISAP